MPDNQAEAEASAEIEAVIVRACARCSGPRVADQPCGQCGNPDPPEITRLSVVSATYTKWWRKLWWDHLGKRLADRRIRQAAERTATLSHQRAESGKV